MNRAYVALTLCNLRTRRRRAIRWACHGGRALVGLLAGAWLSVWLGWAERVTLISAALQTAALLFAILAVFRAWWLGHQIRRLDEQAGLAPCCHPGQCKAPAYPCCDDCPRAEAG